MLTDSVKRAEIWGVGFEDVSGRLEIALCTLLFPEKVFILMQKYLVPLIMGGKEDRKQLQRIESNISEMSGSVTQTGKD